MPHKDILESPPTPSLDPTELPVTDGLNFFKLPTELWENILEFCDNLTLFNLRLTSKESLLLCSGKKFTDKIQHKTVEWTNIKVLRQLVKDPDFTRLVKTLTIKRRIYDTRGLVRVHRIFHERLRSGRFDPEDHDFPTDETIEDALAWMFPEEWDLDSDSNLDSMAVDARMKYKREMRAYRNGWIQVMRAHPAYKDQDPHKFVNLRENSRLYNFEDPWTAPRIYCVIERAMFLAEEEILEMADVQQTRDKKSPLDALKDMQAIFKALGKLDKVSIVGEVFDRADRSGQFNHYNKRLLSTQLGGSFQTVTLALLNSGLKTPELSILNSPLGDTQATFALRPCMVVIPFLAAKAMIGNSLKRLTLRLVVENDDSGVAAAESAALKFRDHYPDEGSFVVEDNLALSRLLQETPNLEDLNVCMSCPSEESNLTTEVFESMAENVHLASLKTCRLEGFHVTEEMMIMFLEKHQEMHSFSLVNVTLTSGSWEPIMTLLQQMRPLRHITLALLFSLEDNVTIVNLRPVWDPNGKTIGWKSHKCPPRMLSCGGEDMVIVDERSFGQYDMAKGLVFEHFA